MKYARNAESYRDAAKRISDWDEIYTKGHEKEERAKQAARCMDCGTPFCQTHTGCPVNNLIPEWNELVFKDQVSRTARMMRYVEHAAVSASSALGGALTPGASSRAKPAVEGCKRPAAQDEQLPRIYGPRVPCALRGSMRDGAGGSVCDHQEH
jgi:hypothetical protein